MSNYDTGSRAYMQSIFNGQTPVERQTVLPGQSKYYYYKPGQSDDIAVSDMKTVDVPTADTPNPYNQYTNNEEGGVSNWNKFKQNTKNMIDTVLPYIPTYRVGYGVGVAQNTFNKLKNLYNAYKQNGAKYAAQQHGEPSVKRAIKAAERLMPLEISDVNKHQYVSCVGSTGGLLAAAETLVGGAKKEIDDYKKEMNDPQLFEQYGGKSGILDDIKKDLGNDFKGAWKGFWSDNPDECEELLPEPYQNQRYW